MQLHFALRHVALCQVNSRQFILRRTISQIVQCSFALLLNACCLWLLMIWCVMGVILWEMVSFLSVRSTTCSRCSMKANEDFYSWVCKLMISSTSGCFPSTHISTEADALYVLPPRGWETLLNAYVFPVDNDSHYHSSFTPSRPTWIVLFRNQNQSSVHCLIRARKKLTGFSCSNHNH